MMNVHDSTWLPSTHQLRDRTGFTAHPLHGAYMGGGYSVSPYPTRSQTLHLSGMCDTDLLDAVMAFASENSDLLKLPDHYVGGWHPAANADALTLDVAIVTPYEQHAEALRVEYGQTDFYDFEAGISRPHNIRTLIGGS